MSENPLIPATVVSVRLMKSTGAMRITLEVARKDMAEGVTLYAVPGGQLLVCNAPPREEKR